MRTPLIAGTRPGQFRAVCRLRKPHRIDKMPDYLRRECEKRGWKKGFRTFYDGRFGKGIQRECFLEPLCAGFDTTDPKAFAVHMAEAHGKKPSGPRQLKQGRGMWNGPRLTVEGKPFDDKGALQTCTSCGLVAEVDDRAANVLWWAEHERGCALAQVAAS
jgi:hypothetical protein